MSRDVEFFDVRDVVRVDARSIRISEDLILTGKEREAISWEVPDSQSSGDVTKPPARIPSPREIRWRLPGRNTEFYSRIKTYAGAVGYQTVEHDDPSYSG